MRCPQSYLKALAKASASEKAQHVEAALLDNIPEGMGPQFETKRFVPLVMMHEFKALLFSNPIDSRKRLEEGGTAQFRAIREGFESSEDIDDPPETAPSKRIESPFPGYERPLLGVLAAIGTGRATIRQQCPHFNDWLKSQEALPGVLTSQV
jgi:hypothetical protein